MNKKKSYSKFLAWVQIIACTIVCIASLIIIFILPPFNNVGDVLEFIPILACVLLFGWGVAFSLANMYEN